MQDAIIKGNGNSRYLKTVAAALSLYPTYEDMLQAMIAGTFPIDLNGINADGWTQQGTPLNKGNLLSDTVEKAIWNNLSNRTVNDALAVLGDVGNVHVWKRDTIYEEGVPAGYTLGNPQVLVLLQGTSSSSTFSLKYGDIIVTPSGSISWNGSGKTISGSYSDHSFVNSTIPGKFIQFGGNYYFVPETATVNSAFSSSTYYVRIYYAQLVTGYPEIPAGTVTDYPTSTDRNAFGEGFQDYQPAGYTLGEAEEVFFTGGTNATTQVRTFYGDSVSVSPSGEVSASFTSYADVSYNAYTNADALKGKFIQTASGIANIQTSEKIYYIPTDATFLRKTQLIGGTNHMIVYTPNAQPVIGYHETDSAYLAYLGALGDKTRIEVGSYVGTGTCGIDNKTVVPLSGTPSFVYIQDTEAGIYFGLFMYGAQSTCTDISTHRSATVSWSESSLSFYWDGVASPAGQLNYSNRTYRYAIIY